MQENDLVDGRCTPRLSLIQRLQRHVFLSTLRFKRLGAFQIWYMASDLPVLYPNTDSSNSRSIPERTHRDRRAHRLQQPEPYHRGCRLEQPRPPPRARFRRSAKFMGRRQRPPIQPTLALGRHQGHIHLDQLARAPLRGEYHVCSPVLPNNVLM